MGFREIESTGRELARKSLTDLLLDHNTHPLIKEMSIQRLREIIKDPSPAIKVFQADTAAK